MKSLLPIKKLVFTGLAYLVVWAAHRWLNLELGGEQTSHLVELGIGLVAGYAAKDKRVQDLEAKIERIGDEPLVADLVSRLVPKVEALESKLLEDPEKLASDPGDPPAAPSA